MKSAYDQLLQSKQLNYDSAQLTAVTALTHLTAELLKQQKQRQQALLARWRRAPVIHGLYFYGRVGRGKTMLMDLFYQHLPIVKKQRIHFHRFMESVHNQLNSLAKIDNPLAYIAKSWHKKVDLLCFDEFFVSDIGDAMLIAGLLEALFKQGIVLVATSNCAPENLYLNGLQRERFLPTIDLLTQHCQILSIDGEYDYRLSSLKQCKNTATDIAITVPYRDYVYPVEKFLSYIEQCYRRLAAQRQIQPGMIQVNNRYIPYQAQANKVIWFDFFALCSGPRSQRDYIDLADRFSTVVLTGVPQFSGNLVPAVFSGVEDSYQRPGVLMAGLRQLDDEARRFIALVDEFYDTKVRLIISAEVDIEQLYQGQQLAFEFARCQSRLFEMQSWNY